MRKRNFGTAAMVMVLFLSLVSSGCLGRFAAFNKLSNWNQKVTPDKFVNEVVFLALVIVPVYEIALLADAIVLNSIEFWTGKNPMMAEGDPQKIVRSGEHQVVQTFHQNQEIKMMVTQYYTQGRLDQTVTLSQRADSPEFNGVVKTSDGRTENFVIRAEETNILLTRSDSKGNSTTEIVEGPALASISEKVAGLMTPHPVRLVSAH